MGYTTAWAPRPAELNACIECGLCLPTCPTYRLTGEETASPRGRLSAMSAVAAGVVTIDETFAEVMGFCLQCRACETACPSLVPFGRAMEGARAEIAAALPTCRGRMRRWLVGRGLARRGLMRASTTMAALGQRVGGRRWLPRRLRRGLTGLRRLPLWGSTHIGGDHPAIGEELGVAALLTGCVMDPWFGDVHAATIAVLRRAGYRVVTPSVQTCCGALAAHDGAAAAAESLARRNVAAFAGVDVVAVNAAGCGAHLKEYRHWAGPEGAEFAAKVHDVTEIVAWAVGDGRLPTMAPTKATVAVQDPCHLRHGQRVVDEPRVVVTAAGFQVVEPPEAWMCCGAAGLYSVMRPEASSALGERKAGHVLATGAAVVASANPGCEMQLRSFLGRDVRVAHPVELYAEALGLMS